MEKTIINARSPHQQRPAPSPPGATRHLGAVISQRHLMGKPVSWEHIPSGYLT